MIKQLNIFSARGTLLSKLSQLGCSPLQKVLPEICETERGLALKQTVSIA